MGRLRLCAGRGCCRVCTQHCSVLYWNVCFVHTVVTFMHIRGRTLPITPDTTLTAMRLFKSEMRNVTENPWWFSPYQTVHASRLHGCAVCGCLSSKAYFKG